MKRKLWNWYSKNGGLKPRRRQRKRIEYAVAIGKWDVFFPLWRIPRWLCHENEKLGTSDQFVGLIKGNLCLDESSPLTHYYPGGNGRLKRRSCLSLGRLFLPLVGYPGMVQGGVNLSWRNRSKAPMFPSCLPSFLSLSNLLRATDLSFGSV